MPNKEKVPVLFGGFTIQQATINISNKMSIKNVLPIKIRFLTYKNQP